MVNLRHNSEKNSEKSGLHLRGLITALFYLLFAYPGLSFAESEEPVAVSESYLFDPESKLTFEDILKPETQSKFDQPGAKGLSFGWIGDPAWFKLEVVELRHVGTLFLSVNWPLLDDMQVYFVNDVNELVKYYHVGDTKPFNERPIFDPNFVFPVPFSDLGIKTIYFRVHTKSSLQLPYTFATEKSYFKTQTFRTLGQGIFFGLMGTIAFYTLFLYLSTRRPAYLHYILFVLSFTMVQAGVKSTGFQFVWPNMPGFNNYAIASMGALALVFLNTFARTFLRLDELKILSHISLGFIGLGVLFLLFSFILPYIMVIVPLAITIILSAITVIGMAIYRYRQGYREARFYLLAWFAMVLGSIVYLFKQLGLLPMNFYTEASMQIGSTLEVLLLSLALADRLNILSKKLELTNKNLESEVDARTEELRVALSELGEANEVLAELSTTDKLTGLKNRYFFDRELTKELARCSRTKTNLSLLIIDIDKFKPINDTYGHIIGDKVIAFIGEFLKTAVKRITDNVCRYGGEEFTLILPNTAIGDATNIAEKIRHEIHSRAFIDGNHKLQITVSIGVASLGPGESTSNEVFIRAADIALYNAKENGRNCVHYFTGDIEKDSSHAASLSQPYQGDVQKPVSSEE